MGVELQIYSSLIPAEDAVGRSISHFICSIDEEMSSIHWTGDWVASKADATTTQGRYPDLC
jgi:hypothetical protein